jgi:demethylmenaquinone methyltransferase / 2-methoxy-6-polyprenyl-1,4-benzoquinol methylase
VTHPVRPHPALTQYYADDGDRQDYLRSIFNETALYYDRANWLFSFGTGEWYRRRALRRAGLRPGMRLLDIATGTGLVAAAADCVTGGDGEIIGLDPSECMLREARRKLPILLVQSRAETLPLAASSVDFISMGYALRHIGDLSVAFAEFHRVLRPGGTLFMMEIGRPDGLIAHALAATYLGKVIPWLSGWLRPGSNLPVLMQYHWDTIEHCVAPEVIQAQLGACAFSDVACETDLGLFRAYRSVKPAMCCQSDETCYSRHDSAAEEADLAQSGAK